jgi:hypothetical protein
VQQNEGALVAHAKVAREGERRLALNLVAEDGDCREVGAERELMRGKERSRGNREVSLASATTETGRAVRTAAIIGVQAAARWANWRAACLRPADFSESHLGLGVRHAEHLREIERLGRSREKEVLRHVDTAPNRANMTLYR